MSANAESLAYWLRLVPQSPLISFLDHIRSELVFTPMEARARWTELPDSLVSVLEGLSSAGILVQTDGEYELTESGREDVNLFFEGIAWARAGGQWDQPLSVAYAAALRQFHELIEKSGGSFDVKELHAIAESLKVAEYQESVLPGLIFEAVGIGGGNAAASRPVRCGLVQNFRARVLMLSGMVDHAAQDYCRAFENFLKGQRADLVLSVQGDLDRVWEFVTSNRDLSSRTKVLTSLQQLRANLDMKWRYTFSSRIFSDPELILQNVTYELVRTPATEAVTESSHGASGVEISSPPDLGTPDLGFLGDDPETEMMEKFRLLYESFPSDQEYYQSTIMVDEEQPEHA